MTIFQKIKNWNKLIRYIRIARAEGKSDFTLLTTSSKIIMYPRNFDTELKQLRLPTENLNKEIEKQTE